MCSTCIALVVGSVFGVGIHVIQFDGQTYSSPLDGFYAILQTSAAAFSLNVQAVFTNTGTLT